jgi:hypothetical protein
LMQSRDRKLVSGPKGQGREGMLMTISGHYTMTMLINLKNHRDMQSSVHDVSLWLNMASVAADCLLLLTLN